MVVIKGGRVVDPGHLDGVYDIYIDEGKIVDIVDPSGGKAPLTETPEEIPAAGKIVTPGEQC